MNQSRKDLIQSIQKTRKSLKFHVNRNPKASSAYRHIQQLEQELEEEVAAEEEPKTLGVSQISVRKFRTIGVVCVIIGYFVFQSLNFIYLIVAAFIIAMAIETLILYFQKRFSRGFSIGIAYVLFIIFIISGALLVVPFVVGQIADLVNSIIASIAALVQVIQEEGLQAVIMDSGLPTQVKTRITEGMQEQSRVLSLQEGLVNNLSQIVSVGGDSLKGAGGLAVTIITGLFAAIFQVSLVFVCSIFFSIEKEKVIHFLADASGRATRTELVLRRLYRKLGFRMKGQLVLCLAIGVLVRIGLIILGRIGIDLPNKFSLALIAGLTEFIPYLGPFMGMVPALLVAGIAHGFAGIVAILILYRIIQQSENNVLVPMVMYHTLGVSPLLIFICMVVGGSILGFLGVLLAVPIAVIISILYEGYSTKPIPEAEPQ